MAVYYKFKCAKDYNSVSIEGQSVSVAFLKERIFKSKYLGRDKDFDLVISNAQTEEEYGDESAMIPKNTSVLIRRIPGRQHNAILMDQEEVRAIDVKAEDLKPSIADDLSTKYPGESEFDEFGDDPYNCGAPPSEASKPTLCTTSGSKFDDEDSKIRALVNTPALEWNSHVQDGYGSGQGYSRGRMMGNRGFGRGFEHRMPPLGYVCHRCKVPGHFIQHCPTNGDPNFDVRRVKLPTGIPKSMLMPNPEGFYALPSGAVAILKPNEAAFEKEIEGMPTTRPNVDLPPELLCPLCKEVMKDAVLTSKCCFQSFCDKCVRLYIISNSKCVCGAMSIADDLLPNRTLRETISRVLDPTTGSTEILGSVSHIQDMASADSMHPKVTSPANSTGCKHVPEENGVRAHHSEPDSASGINASDINMSSSEKKPATISDVTEKSPVLAGDTWEKHKLPGLEQGKKKKKAVPEPGNDDAQWRNYPDLGAESFAAMSMAAAAGYNSYWTGGAMPVGMEGFVAPFSTSYMGCTPMPFGGAVILQDPYLAQAYMTNSMPRCLPEFSGNGMGVNLGPPTAVTGRDMHARKPDYRLRQHPEWFRKRDGWDKSRYSQEEMEKVKDMGRREQSRNMESTQERIRSRAVASPNRARHAPRRPESPHFSLLKSRQHPHGYHAANPSWPPPSATEASNTVKSESKSKGSVFSCISYPEGDSKRRKAGNEEAQLFRRHATWNRKEDDRQYLRFPGGGRSSPPKRR